MRVRLRPGSPYGLTALVWLPDNVTEREASLKECQLKQGPYDILYATT